MRAIARPIGAHCLKETNDRFQIASRQCCEQAACLGLHAFIEPCKLGHGCRNKCDDQAATILRIWLAAHEAGSFQPIQCNRDAPAAETRSCTEVTRCGRPVELKHVDHLHIGQAETGFFRSLRIEENRCGDEFADFQNNMIRQGDRCRYPDQVGFAGAPF